MELFKIIFFTHTADAIYHKLTKTFYQAISKGSYTLIPLSC